MLRLAVAVVILAGAPSSKPAVPKAPPAARGAPDAVDANERDAIAHLKAEHPAWQGYDGGVDINTLKTMDLSPLVEILKTGGDGGTAFAKYKWNVPDLEYYIDVPAVQIVNGLPVRFSAAVSKAKPDFLVKYYVDEFTKAGLYIPPAEHQMTMAAPAFQLTALDTENLVSYTVMLQVVNEKQTTVIMGQGFLEPWMRRQAPGPDFAPLFPRSESVVRSKGEGVDMLQFVTDADPATVRAFYLEVMGKAGYVQPSPDEFAKGVERINLKVAKMGSGKKTGVLLQRRASGAPAEMPLP